jgi:hypothetical protein
MFELFSDIYFILYKLYYVGQNDNLGIRVILKNWDRGSTILLLLDLFTFLHTITFYHSIRLILCLQQTGEIDNLIVSWGKVLGCVVCRFHVAASEKLHVDKYPGAIVQSVAKLVDINLRKCGSFSYWFDKPWFHNWGKTCCCAHHNFTLGVSQLVY